MSKELCKMKKSLSIDITSYMLYVNRPSHICSKWGRAANNKNLLCHPVKIKN